MHDDQLDLDPGLVRRMLARRFPHWAELPIGRVDSPGTVNAMFRLGDDMVVRMPFVPSGAADVEREAEWLPRLASALPAPIPHVLGVGAPDADFPHPWLVLDWLPGENPTPGSIADPVGLARDLAAFVRALHAVPTAGAPAGYRAGALGPLDEPVHICLAQIARLDACEADQAIDVDTLDAVWRAALAAPPWRGRAVWTHGDLLPGNILTREGRLTGVLDFAAAGIGDPACDAMAAWSILPRDARTVFLTEVRADDATWARGRGWALAQAVIALPYYVRTNPAMASGARHVLAQLAES